MSTEIFWISIHQTLAVTYIGYGIKIQANLGLTVIIYTWVLLFSGTLLNSVLIDICGNITSLEDISADDAVQLHTLLSIITQQAPELFQSQREGDDEEAASDTPSQSKRHSLVVTTLSLNRGITCMIKITVRTIPFKNWEGADRRFFDCPTRLPISILWIPPFRPFQIEGTMKLLPVNII